MEYLTNNSEIVKEILPARDNNTPVDVKIKIKLRQITDVVSSLISIYILERKLRLGNMGLGASCIKTAKGDCLTIHEIREFGKYNGNVSKDVLISNSVFARSQRRP